MRVVIAIALAIALGGCMMRFGGHATRLAPRTLATPSIATGDAVDPNSSPNGAPVPSLGTEAAGDQVSAPPKPRASTCHSNLYAEPSFLFGATRNQGVARIRGAGGFRYARCPSPTGPEGFNIRLGMFIEGGSEEIGDAFSWGPELEWDTPYRGNRLGVRAGVGLGNVPTVSLGGRARWKYVALGLDIMYSTHANGQGAAVGVLGNLSLRGVPALVVIGIAGGLAVLVLATFSTT